jgi:hypothetical protein
MMSHKSKQHHTTMQCAWRLLLLPLLCYTAGLLIQRHVSGAAAAAAVDVSQSVQVCVP